MRLLWKLRTRVAIVAALMVTALMSIVLSAQSTTTVTSTSGLFQELFTLPNILTISVFIFHFGMLRQTIADMRSRMEKLEAWRDEGAPDTFARQDRMGDALRTIAERLDSIDRRLP